MYKVERRLNRADAKWLHPSNVEEYCDKLPDALSLYAGVEMLTEEEVDKRQIDMGKDRWKAYEESGDADWLEWKNDGEWYEYYTEHGCPEEPDAKPVRIWVRKPKNIKKREKLPAVFSVSGGSLTMAGSVESGAYLAYPFMHTKKIRGIMVSFSYRLAPAYKYPKAINDCHAAYQWMIEHAEELQIDIDRIAIIGGSSGGQLALGMAFRLKRYNWCGAPMPRGVVTIVPVMEDVADTNSHAISFLSEEGTVDNWDADCIEVTLKMWLGERYADPFLSPEAIPSRARLEDVKGFPPVWFPMCAELEPSRDSIMLFATLLNKAGIFCDLHIWGGMTHASSILKSTDIGKRMNQVISGALLDALTYDMRRLWLI